MALASEFPNRKLVDLKNLYAYDVPPKRHTTTVVVGQKGLSRRYEGFSFQNFTDVYHK